MLRDILTVYFIVAGSLLLWLNFRPTKIVLTKDDDDQTGAAHPHPEQNKESRAALGRPSKLTAHHKPRRHRPA